ncbi:MAG TPA: PAS domain-containing protein, partial [Phenylobacterium sp.]
MQRFVLRENAKRFRDRLAEASDEAERRQLTTMLATVERELALLEAAEAGVGARPWPVGSASELEASRAVFVADFRRDLGQSARIAYLIDPAPGLAFVEVNAAFEQATGLSRADVIGRPLFTLFPEN